MITIYDEGLDLNRLRDLIATNKIAAVQYLRSINPNTTLLEAKRFVESNPLPDEMAILKAEINRLTIENTLYKRMLKELHNIDIGNS